MSVLTVQCPACNHRVAGRMTRCLYCGASLKAPAPIARECPRCAAPMPTVEAKWVLIERCGGCGGEFYDAGEMDRVARINDSDMRWLEKTFLERSPDTPGGEPLVCPGCRKPMTTVVVAYGSTRIDICKHCDGIWLDKGEAQKLRHCVADRNMPRGVAPDIQREIDEFSDFARDAADLLLGRDP